MRENDFNKITVQNKRLLNQLKKQEKLLYLLGLDNETITNYTQLNNDVSTNNKLDNTTSSLSKVLFQLTVDKENQIKFTYISKSIENIYIDISVEKVLNDASCLLSKVHEDDLPLLLSSLQNAKDTLKEWKIEFRNIGIDGKIIWMNIVAIPEVVSKDKTLFNGIAENFTNIKFTQNKLSQIEEKFSHLANSISDGIVIFDKNYALEYVSPGYLKQLGYSLEEQSIRTPDDIYEIIHPDDRDKIFNEIFKQIELKNRNFLYSFRIKNKEGHYIWREDNAYFNFDENENYLGAYVICRDITKAKLEENQLKLLESVILNTTDSVLITEAEPMDEPGPRIIYVNDAFTKMTGYTAEEVIGKSPRILQGPKSDKVALKELGEAMRRWEKHEVTTINYKKNGDEFWINFTVCPIANENGWFTHWIAIEKDVTESKNLEIQNTLLADISAIFNKEISITDSFNEIFEKFSVLENFFTIEAYLVDSYQQEMNLIAYQSNDLSHNEIPEILKKGDGLAGMVWQNGSFKIWENFYNDEKYIHPEAKKAYGIPLIVHNQVMGVIILTLSNNQKIKPYITSTLLECANLLSKEVERKKLENQLSQVFNFAPDIICIASLDGYFKKVNPATCEILGYTEEELLSKPYVEFVHPDDKLNTEVKSNSLKDNIIIYYFENRYISKSGEIIWLAWAASPIPNEKSIYAIAKDITDKKLLEFQRTKITNDLLQRNRDLEQFNFIISHNLRAPTANIIAIANILNEPNLSAEEQKEFLTRLSSSVNLLDTVIKDINTILQIKVDVNEKKEILYFSDILDDVKTSIANLIEKNNVQIIGDFKSIDSIFSLKIFLYSIFYNLINNSIKYAKPNVNAFITIESQKIDNKVLLYFTDNGLGINLKSKQNKIFGLYKRFHTHVEGKGMGLFMVKSQVESLGGKINIESELNVGTKFTLEFENIIPQ